MNHPKPRLLGIAGSLRKGSYNTIILEALSRRIESKAALHIHSLSEVPLYSQDLDTDTPPPGVAAFRKAIAEADGLIIASPEYNHGMSGVLKNAIDWATRPYGRATIIEKPVLTMTSSPATTGGVRAQAQLNEALIAVSAKLVAQPQIVIATVHEKIRDGRLEDEPTLAFLDAGVDRLLAVISRVDFGQTGSGGA